MKDITVPLESQQSRYRLSGIVEWIRGYQKFKERVTNQNSYDSEEESKEEYVPMRQKQDLLYLRISAQTFKTIIKATRPIKINSIFLFLATALDRDSF